MMRLKDRVDKRSKLASKKMFIPGPNLQQQSDYLKMLRAEVTLSDKCYGFDFKAAFVSVPRTSLSNMLHIYASFPIISKVLLVLDKASRRHGTH